MLASQYSDKNIPNKEPWQTQVPHPQLQESTMGLPGHNPGRPFRMVNVRLCGALKAGVHGQ